MQHLFMIQCLSISGPPWFARSQGQYNVRGFNFLWCQNELNVIVKNQHFWCFPPQGDAGGILGIVPLKGDRGFAGTPGFPVSSLHTNASPRRFLPHCSPCPCPLFQGPSGPIGPVGPPGPRGATGPKVSSLAQRPTLCSAADSEGTWILMKCLLYREILVSPALPERRWGFWFRTAFMCLSCSNTFAVTLWWEAEMKSTFFLWSSRRATGWPLWARKERR